MILFSFIILSILITLGICLLTPLNNYMTSPIYILICIGVFIASFIVLILLFALFLTIYLSKVDMSKKQNPKKFDMNLMKRASEFVLQVSNIKLHTRGIENLPLDKKFLFVQNHLSNYDVVATTWALRDFDISYIFKMSLLKVPFLGKFLHKVRQLAIDRSDNRQGLRVIIDAINLIKDNYHCVGVYPEGTRSKDHNLAPFHAGTFKIALKAQCPLVVTTIVNTEAKKYHTIFRPTHVYFDVVKVLEYDDYKDLTSEEIAEYAHQLIEDNLKELDILRDKPYLKHKKIARD